MSNIIEFPSSVVTKRTQRIVARANMEALVSTLGCVDEISKFAFKINKEKVVKSSVLIRNKE